MRTQIHAKRMVKHAAHTQEIQTHNRYFEPLLRKTRTQPLSTGSVIFFMPLIAYSTATSKYALTVEHTNVMLYINYNGTDRSLYRSYFSVVVFRARAGICCSVLFMLIIRLALIFPYFFGGRKPDDVDISGRLATWLFYSDLSTEFYF